MIARLYHNPRCSKSRGCLQWLREHGVEVEEVRYLETPLNQLQLTELLVQLGMTPEQLVRRGESLYQELGLATASSQQLLQAMLDHPILIERPIVVVGGRAVVARPPERAGELFVANP